jgi:hypothetical protein
MEEAEHLGVSLINLSRWERQLIAPSKVVLRGIEAQLSTAFRNYGHVFE